LVSIGEACKNIKLLDDKSFKKQYKFTKEELLNVKKELRNKFNKEFKNQVDLNKYVKTTKNKKQNTTIALSILANDNRKASNIESNLEEIKNAIDLL